MPKTNTESLRLLTEQFELIRDFLRTDSAVQAKVAVILLDSISDTLMYDISLREFDRQSELAAIRRPKYDPERRDKIGRGFGRKLAVARDLNLITESNATVLRIGHSYRNAAYHRDSHNPCVLGLFGHVLFSTVMALFVDYFDNGITVGGVHEPWLAAYGIEGSSFSFGRASSAVAAKLNEEMGIPLADMRTTLEDDLRQRVATIENRIAGLPAPFADNVDEGLKRAEFQRRFPQEQFFAELHELHYKIVGDDSEKVTSATYAEAEKAANTKLTLALSSFTPIASLATLQVVKDSRRLANAQNVSAVLLGYEDLDGKLDRLETALDGLEVTVEKAMEYVQNIRRGK